MDPLDFLVRHAPFDALSASGRARIADALEITWARAGDTILQSGGANTYLYTVRKGHVRLDLDGQRVAELGTGEIFGLTVLAEDEESPRLDVTAVRDCLLYRWPRDAVRDLCDTEPGFARFFLDRLADRLQRLARSQAMPLTSDLGCRVDELVKQSPVTLTLGSQHETTSQVAATQVTVGDAARRMAEARVSSVLLVEEDRERPLGIVTDRDLRDRVLARGLGPDVPVRQVMTTPVEWIDAATPGSEALLHLLRQGRRHLVLEDEGRLAGVVSQSDLLRGHLQSPAALLETIHAATRADDLTDYVERIAETVATLHRSGVEATDIGRLVAALNDTLSARLLDLAEAELTTESGPPPCDYAWIVFGSEGRREQSFLTDQDNALIYAAGSKDASTWFEHLAQLAVDSLARVGFPLCEGGFMATQWCLPIGEWEDRFAAWIDEPDPENLMRVLNFFDWRRVAGSLELDALESIVSRAHDSKIFIAQLARASMQKRPPLGLLHRIVRDDGGVDLKSGALMPIAGLARLFAIEAESRDGSTLQRLVRASRAGTVSPGGAEILAEAFRFTFGLRLKAQLADREAGRPIGHYIDPDDLSASERRHLREAFLAIDRMQKATESRLGTDHLG